MQVGIVLGVDCGLHISNIPDDFEQEISEEKGYL
jgi:hypothetical protein